MDNRTSFIVDIANSPMTFIALLSVFNIFVMLVFYYFFGMLAGIIVMGLLSGIVAYKMLRPNELVLKVDNKIVTLLKNNEELISCNDHELEISFSRHYRYGYYFLMGSLNQQHVARIHFHFTNSKKIAFTVYDSPPFFAPHYSPQLFDFKSIFNFTWDVETNYASAMQVQRLIDYYNLNHLLTFKQG